MSSSDDASDVLKYRNIKFSISNTSEQSNEDNEKDEDVFQNGGKDSTSFRSYLSEGTKSLKNKYYTVDAMMFKRPKSDDEDEEFETPVAPSKDQVDVVENSDVGDKQQNSSAIAPGNFGTPQGTLDVAPNTIDVPQSTFDVVQNNFDIAHEMERTDKVDGIMKFLGARPKEKLADVETNPISLVQKSRVYNTRALSRFAETYELENFEKNAMLIFNQENCNGYRPRYGTKKDGRDLKRTFEKFGFEVEEKFDLSRSDIFKKLKDFSEKNYTDYGCIAVVFLTHGSDMGSLRAKDKRFYESDIVRFFNKSERPTLITKPIIIIIQACRGAKMSKAVAAGEAEDRIRKDTDKEDISYHLPVESDMLVLHSTYAGRLAIRHELEGSWFIQTLCNKINELSPTLDLESIMTKVKNEVAIDMELEEYNRATGLYEIYKQMPSVQSTLIRKLHLRKFNEKIFSPLASPDIASKEVDVLVLTKSPVTLPFAPCACKLDVFDYLKTCMTHFVEDNPEDEIAKSYLELAEEFNDGHEFHEAKKKMATLIRNHLKNAARECHYYKFLYFFKDTKVTNTT